MFTADRFVDNGKHGGPCKIAMAYASCAICFVGDKSGLRFCFAYRVKGAHQFALAAVVLPARRA